MPANSMIAAITKANDMKRYTPSGLMLLPFGLLLYDHSKLTKNIIMTTLQGWGSGQGFIGGGKVVQIRI